MKIYDGTTDSTNFQSQKPLSLNSCGQSRNREFLVIRENGRVDYHVLYIVSGTCIAEYDGKEYRLCANQFILYPPHKRQKYQYCGDNETKTLWVHFSGTEVPPLLASLSLEGGIYAGESTELFTSFRGLIREYRERTPRWKERCAFLLGVLLCDLSRVAHSTAPLRREVSAFVEYVHEHFGGRIDVSRFAAREGLSESRFSHLFRSETGFAPHRYLLETRLGEADRLLGSTDLTVSEIAERVGFDDPLYFSRVYRKYRGIPPAAVRRKKTEM